jgi:hypothetical protein
MAFPKITRRKVFSLVSGSSILTAAITARAKHQMSAPTGILFSDSRVKSLSTSGQQLAGAYYLFYLAGTSTAANVYPDDLLTTPLSQVPGAAQPSCTADPSGRFNPIYLNPATVYRVQLFTAGGAKLEDTDPYLLPGIANQATLGALLWPQTATEIAAGVTPTSYAYPYLCLERYGADPTGAADSTIAFNTAFAVGRKDGNCQTHSWSGGTYKINGNLTIYTDHVGFDGRGCTLIGTGIATGYLWNPANDTTDPVRRPGLNGSHPIENFVAFGPGKSVRAGFINFNDSSGVNCIAGIVIRNGSSFNWQTHANYGIGSYFELFQNWYFDSDSSGLGSNTFINMPGTTQSGERNSFINCRFGVASVTDINHADGNADTFFINCSFNGASRFVTQTGGKIDLRECHIESASDTNYWLSTTGANSVLVMHGGSLVIGTNKSAFPLFYCDSTVTAGMVSVRDVEFACSFKYALPLIGGTGNAFANNITSYASGAQPYYIAASLNDLADPGFESGAFAKDGWIVTGTTPPTVATTNPHTGTRSAKLAGINGQTNSISILRACRPGQVFSGQVWAAVTGWGTGTNGLHGQIDYVAADGSVLAAQHIMGASGIGATTPYTLYPIRTARRAPAGTVNVRLTFSMFGITTGTPFGYVDDIELNVT